MLQEAQASGRRMDQLEEQTSGNLNRINDNSGRIADLTADVASVSSVVRNLEIPSVAVVNTISVRRQAGVAV